jgi:F0F1-type ATP synthase assembly protein I
LYLILRIIDASPYNLIVELILGVAAVDIECRIGLKGGILDIIDG